MDSASLLSRLVVSMLPKRKPIRNRVQGEQLESAASETLQKLGRRLLHGIWHHLLLPSMTTTSACCERDEIRRKAERMSLTRNATCRLLREGEAEFALPCSFPRASQLRFRCVSIYYDVILKGACFQSIDRIQ